VGAFGDEMSALLTSGAKTARERTSLQEDCARSLSELGLVQEASCVTVTAFANAVFALPDDASRRTVIDRFREMTEARIAHETEQDGAHLVPERQTAYCATVTAFANAVFALPEEASRRTVIDRFREMTEAQIAQRDSVEARRTLDSQS
jgi:hypothetical protein